jgi:excisionase family DNA binding protein
MMPDKWTTVAEAATQLKCHTRTIERRIASGKIQTRRTESGVLQVLIDVSDEASTAPETALETVRELAADQVTLATGSASALVRFAQNDALQAREELIIIRQDARRARHSALAAWLVVASMGIGVTVAVGWTASKITRANSDVRQMTDYAKRMEGEAQELLADRDAARQDARQAQLQGAEASGKLAAYVEQHKALLEMSERHPTTRPATVVERLIWAFSND